MYSNPLAWTGAFYIAHIWPYVPLLYQTLLRRGPHARMGRYQGSQAGNQPSRSGHI